ncbi:hypothetical protein [Burkholderia sp. ABCPW 14]|uniref:hypothetical protein n=1 Tax=Burkholderia sp. ABCPW 14 TaxID=1637860 RepID=UPI0018D1FA27|nr:hypothetical protein [Burkholderia sp. ABCPW 14]
MFQRITNPGAGVFGLKPVDPNPHRRIRKVAEAERELGMDRVAGVAHFGALNVGDRLAFRDIPLTINDNRPAHHSVDADIPRVEIIGELDVWPEEVAAQIRTTG